MSGYFINPYIDDPYAKEAAKKKEEEQYWKNLTPTYNQAAKSLGIPTPSSSALSDPNVRGEFAERIAEKANPIIAKVADLMFSGVPITQTTQKALQIKSREEQLEQDRRRSNVERWANEKETLISGGSVTFIPRKDVYGKDTEKVYQEKERKKADISAGIQGVEDKITEISTTVGENYAEIYGEAAKALTSTPQEKEEWINNVLNKPNGVWDTTEKRWVFKYLEKAGVELPEDFKGNLSPEQLGKVRSYLQQEYGNRLDKINKQKADIAGGIAAVYGGVPGQLFTNLARGFATEEWESTGEFFKELAMFAPEYLDGAITAVQNKGAEGLFDYITDSPASAGFVAAMTTGSVVKLSHLSPTIRMLHNSHVAKTLTTRTSSYVQKMAGESAKNIGLLRKQLSEVKKTLDVKQKEYLELSKRKSTDLAQVAADRGGIGKVVKELEETVQQHRILESAVGQEQTKLKRALENKKLFDEIHAREAKYESLAPQRDTAVWSDADFMGNIDIVPGEFAEWKQRATELAEQHFKRPPTEKEVVDFITTHTPEGDLPVYQISRDIISKYPTEANKLKTEIIDNSRNYLKANRKNIEEGFKLEWVKKGDLGEKTRGDYGIVKTPDGRTYRRVRLVKPDTLEGAYRIGQFTRPHEDSHRIMSGKKGKDKYSSQLFAEDSKFIIADFIGREGERGYLEKLDQRLTSRVKSYAIGALENPRAYLDALGVGIERLPIVMDIMKNEHPLNWSKVLSDRLGGNAPASFYQGFVDLFLRDASNEFWTDVSAMVLNTGKDAYFLEKVYGNTIGLPDHLTNTLLTKARNLNISFMDAFEKFYKEFGDEGSKFTHDAKLQQEKGWRERKTVERKGTPVELSENVPLTRHDAAVSPEGMITANLKKEDLKLPITDKKINLHNYIYNHNGNHAIGGAVANIYSMSKGKLKLKDIKLKLKEMVVDPLLKEEGKASLNEITASEWNKFNQKLTDKMRDLPVGLGGKRGRFFEISEKDFKTPHRLQHQLEKIDDAMEMIREFGATEGQSIYGLHQQTLGEMGVEKLTDLMNPEMQRTAIERLKANEPYIMTMLEAAKEGKMKDRARLNTLLRFYQGKAGVWGVKGANEGKCLAHHPSVSWLVHSIKETSPKEFNRIMERANIRNANGKLKEIHEMTLGDEFAFSEAADIKYRQLSRRVLTPRADVLRSGEWGGRAKIGAPLSAVLYSKYYHNLRPNLHQYVERPNTVWFETKHGVVTNHPLRKEFEDLVVLEVTARSLCVKDKVPVTPEYKRAMLELYTEGWEKRYDELLSLSEKSPEKFKLNIKKKDSARQDFEFRGTVNLEEAVGVYIKHVNEPIVAWGANILEGRGVKIKNREYIPMAINKEGSLGFQTSNSNRKNPRTMKRSGKIYDLPFEQVKTNPASLWERYVKQVVYDAEVQNIMLYIRDIASSVGGEVAENARKGFLPPGVSETLLDSCAEFCNESSRLAKKNAAALYHKMNKMGEGGARGLEAFMPNMLYYTYKAQKVFDKTLDLLLRREPNSSFRAGIIKRLEEGAAKYIESFKEKGKPQIDVRSFNEFEGRLLNMYSTIHMLGRKSIIAQQFFQHINTAELLGMKAAFWDAAGVMVTPEGRARVSKIMNYAKSIYGDTYFTDVMGVNRSKAYGQWEKIKGYGWAPVGITDMWARKMSMIVGSNEFLRIRDGYLKGNINISQFEKQLGLGLIYEDAARTVKSSLLEYDRLNKLAEKASDTYSREAYKKQADITLDNAHNAYALGISNASNYIYDNFGGMRLYGERAFGQFQKFNWAKKQMYIHLFKAMKAEAKRAWANGAGEQKIGVMQGIYNTAKAMKDHEMRATTAFGRTTMFELANLAVIPKSKAGAIIRTTGLAYLLNEVFDVPEGIANGVDNLAPLTFTVPPSFERDGEKWYQDVIRGCGGGLTGFGFDFSKMLLGLAYYGYTSASGEPDGRMLNDAVFDVARDFSPVVLRDFKLIAELASEKEITNFNMSGLILAALFDKPDMPKRAKYKGKSEWYEATARWLGIMDYKHSSKKPKKKDTDKYTMQDEISDSFEWWMDKYSEQSERSRTEGMLERMGREEQTPEQRRMEEMLERMESR